MPFPSKLIPPHLLLTARRSERVKSAAAKSKVAHMQMKTCVHWRACANSAATWLRNGVRRIRGLQTRAHAAHACTQTGFKCFDTRCRRAQMRTKETQGCPASSYVVPVFLSLSLSGSCRSSLLPLAVSNAAVWVSSKNLSQILNRSRIAHNHTLNK